MNNRWSSGHNKRYSPLGVLCSTTFSDVPVVDHILSAKVAMSSTFGMSRPGKWDSLRLLICTKLMSTFPRPKDRALENSGFVRGMTYGSANRMIGGGSDCDLSIVARGSRRSWIFAEYVSFLLNPFYIPSFLTVYISQMG